MKNNKCHSTPNNSSQMRARCDETHVVWCHAFQFSIHNSIPISLKWFQENEVLLLFSVDHLHSRKRKSYGIEIQTVYNIFHWKKHTSSPSNQSNDYNELVFFEV